MAAMNLASGSPVYFDANSRRPKLLDAWHVEGFRRPKPRTATGSDGAWLRWPVESLVYRNRLTLVTCYDTYGQASTKVVDYVYDAFNRLVKETVDPDGASGSTSVEQTVFAYDGMNVVLQFEKTGSGAGAATDLSDRYLWGTAVDQILADEKVHYSSGQFVTDAVLWGLADHEGSIRDIVDNTGTVVDHRVFNSFGEMTESVPATDFIFGYTGKYFDKATGLQNNLERWYDPSTGRWLSQDPLGLGPDVNPYRYCGNSPMTSVIRVGWIPSK